MPAERATSQRILIALVQVLGLATWFSASAVSSSLQFEWKISPAETVWVTASVQVGFVVGAIASAVLNLADRVPANVLLAVSAAGAAVAATAFALLATGLTAAIPLRFLTGVMLAGVYPVGMKLMASWSPSIDRGRWFGVLIGALTLGSALPHLIGVLDAGWRAVILVAAGVTLAGGALSLAFIRTGPHLARSVSKFDPGYVIRMFRDPRQRLINLGYLGHMWELYALWSWMAAFAVAALASSSSLGLNLGVFTAIGIAGVAGALIGGWSSDRWGRARTAQAALAISGICCVISPFVFGAPWAIMLVVGIVWGASVIADSGVFSTMLSELVPGEYAGTALPVQTAIGFMFTVITIQAVPIAAALFGWQFAFLVLAPGPVVGLLALARFRWLEANPNRMKT